MKIVSIVSVAALVAGPLLIAGSVANAATCVPRAAVPATPATPGTPAQPEQSHMVKVIDVEAKAAVEEVSHEEKVVDVEAQAATPDLWWNWSPNKHKGPFVGPPAFPTDPRGTWEGPHENGGPSQDTYGTFKQGHGVAHGSWFHREHGHAAVEEQSHMKKVIDVPGSDAVLEVSHMEKVVDQPGHDMIPGTPGKPGKPAVTCPKKNPKPTPQPGPAPTPEKPKPVVTPPVKTVTPAEENEIVDTPLPHTGAMGNLGLALTALGAIGSGSVLIRKF